MRRTSTPSLIILDVCCAKQWRSCAAFWIRTTPGQRFSVFNSVQNSWRLQGMFQPVPLAEPCPAWLSPLRNLIFYPGSRRTRWAAVCTPHLFRLRRPLPRGCRPREPLCRPSDLSAKAAGFFTRTGVLSWKNSRRRKQSLFSKKSCVLHGFASEVDADGFGRMNQLGIQGDRTDQSGQFLQRDAYDFWRFQGDHYAEGALGRGFHR